MEKPTTASEFELPAIPLADWRPTKDTLHLFCQIIGKIRLTLHPRLNHWWHVPLYVSPRGLTTRSIPYQGGSFEIEFDFKQHKLEIRSSSGETEDFALFDGLSVADFYSSVFANLAKLGINCQIKAVPYEGPSTTPFAENIENRSYDKDHVEKFHNVLVVVNDIFEEFRGRFLGKSTPVHMFWHSFDVALTRFSGRPAFIPENANMVNREAYSHEVISFGFWFGDDNVPAPAFYSYTAPEPENLGAEHLPPPAKWQDANGSHLALLMYDDIREGDDPRGAVLEFLESTYQAGGRLAGWDLEGFKIADLKKR